MLEESDDPKIDHVDHGCIAGDEEEEGKLYCVFFAEVAGLYLECPSILAPWICETQSRAAIMGGIERRSSRHAHLLYHEVAYQVILRLEAPSLNQIGEVVE